jgi:hypothetical protein
MQIQCSKRGPPLTPLSELAIIMETHTAKSKKLGETDRMLLEAKSSLWEAAQTINELQAEKEKAVE